MPSATEPAHRSFLPAAGRDILLPLYDPLVRLLGGDRARSALIDLAEVGRGERVLDLGCGTGTLVVALKRRQPRADVVGLDPDPRALERARAKAQRAGIAVELDRGFADTLPYADRSFDRVFSSFMFHHLSSPERVAMLGEVRRVLKPGGVFHLLDFVHHDDEPRGLVARLLHGSPSLRENGVDRLLSQLTAAGLADPRHLATRALLIGSVAYYEARQPGSTSA